MPKPSCIAVAALMLACAHSAASPTEPVLVEQAGRVDLIAFVDVSVLTMREAAPRRNQTVIVEGKTILRVGGRDSVAVPAGATVINGRGSFTLLPGLVDAHTHSTQLVDLAAYLRNGVTTILNMGQSPSSPVMAARDAINRGETLGPRVYAGWFVDGPGGFAGVVSTPEAAREQVTRAKNAGHEFIKVYNSLSVAQFQAIAEEAAAQHVPIIGHDVRSVGFPAAFANQVMVAHAEEFVPNYFRGSVDAARIQSATQSARAAGTYVTANSSAYDAMNARGGRPAKLDEYLARPEAKYLSASDRAAWPTRGYGQQQGSIAAQWSFVQALVRTLRDGGVPLLAGTDSPFVPGMFPGFAIHDELRTMVESGLTPLEALQAATRMPGEFFERYASGPKAGVVEQGARADLVLVAGDPLTLLSILREPAGVVVAGRWLNRATLLENLERAVALAQGGHLRSSPGSSLSRILRGALSNETASPESTCRYDRGSETPT